MPGLHEPIIRFFKILVQRGKDMSESGPLAYVRGLLHTIKVNAVHTQEMVKSIEDLIFSKEEIDKEEDNE